MTINPWTRSNAHGIHYPVGMDLTEKQEDVVVCHILGMSREEAAADREVSVSAIDRLWQRLRKRIKAKTKRTVTRMFFDGSLPLRAAARRKIMDKLG